ncbi:peptide ABC transporter substrate-binding protein [Oenococcus oeni]|uniref:peptide ABC transporter substrate-binding protein n=1 Tax=Oenococcus oeni TaxID=1247 RepID=UPI0008F916D3|nr:peptide ABC transporter substrate-binding protein [Oenococcus oeni]OIK56323.1 peptide ABC transporter substrate-binding protein [Oenococcus oeni]OIM62627.1 peptide ABC transporter substrate-binding protein [Oenococcus oeni]
MGLINFKKRTNVLLLGSLLLASIGNGLFIPTVASAKTNPTLYFSMPTDLTTMDMALMTDAYADQIAINVQEGLLSRNAKGQVKAGLAEKWKHSSDGKTWTFTLRKGLKWSNGDKVTASDFVYAWQRVVNPKTSSQAAYKYSGIKNADEIQAGKAKVSSFGVVAKNDRTLVVTLDHPMPQFELEMASQSFFAQDPKVAKKYGKQLGTASNKQVYDGPYKLTGWNGTNGKFTLVKNENYWDKKHVKTDKVVETVVKEPTAAIGLYKRGKLDLAPLSSQQSVTANKKRSDFKKYSGDAVYYLEYNQTGKNKGLANKNIRLALSYAIDRKAVANEISGGMYTAATSLVPEGAGGKTSTGEDFAKAAKKYTGKYYKYNMKKAKKLFKTGLKEAGLKSLKISVEATAESPVSKPEVDYLQQTWQKLGNIKVTEKFVPFKQRLQDQQNQNFDVMVVGWSSDYAEPTGFLTLFTNNGTNNDGKWISKAYTNAFNRAMDQDALNTKARTKDEISAEVALAKNAGASPVYWNAYPSLVNPKLKGLQNFNSGDSFYYKYAYLK